MGLFEHQRHGDWHWRMAGAFGGFLLAAAPAFADGDELDKRTHPFSVDAAYGIPVTKSNTMGGTDFGAAYQAGVSDWVGKTKSIGLGVAYDASATKFTQSDASLTSAWTEFGLTYKLFMLYPRVAVGSVTMSGKKIGRAHV